jgi:hypothetical protein
MINTLYARGGISNNVPYTLSQTPGTNGFVKINFHYDFNSEVKIFIFR